MNMNSRAFRRWFGRSKAIDASGAPLVLYHGTTHDFAAFDPSRGNVEANFGCAIYASDSAADVCANYAGIGQDLTSLIQGEAEAIVEALQTDPNEYGLTESEVEEIEEEPGGLEGLAKRLAAYRLVGPAPRVLPLFVRLEKPFILGGPDETFFGYEVGLDEERLKECRAEAWRELQKEHRIPLRERGDWRDEIESRAEELYDEGGYGWVESGLLVEFCRALRYAVIDFECGTAEEACATLVREAEDYEGLKAAEVLRILDECQSFGEARCPSTFRTVNGEIIRRALAFIGFDGVIDRTVWRKFCYGRNTPMPGMTQNTVHYLAFAPNQVKSVFNRGSFRRDCDEIAV